MVNLEDRSITAGEVKSSFEIDDYTRWRLMEGLDDVAITLSHVDDIANFEAKRPDYKPQTLPVRN